MAWDIQTETISLAASAAGKNIGNTYRTEVEKFPLVYYALTETGAPTYTVGFEWSVDGVNWTTLQSTGSLTTGATRYNDLSDEASQPSGAKYIRTYVTPSATLSIGESASVEMVLSWWIDDVENSSGARIV